MVTSRCQVSASDVACEHQLTTIKDSGSDRNVAYEVPIGDPPAGGWPAAIYYQGSFVAGSTAFTAQVSAPFGEANLALTIKALLDQGFAVIAPDASGGGFWETNIPPYSISWSGSPDDVFITNLLGAVASGTFGPLDPTHLYAMGISSGGFMTSRMAVSYPGKFRALADHSGSYATCSIVCAVPTPLPADHPPTLFLHGDLDAIVPLSSIQPYLDDLQQEGHQVQYVSDHDGGHEWLPEGATAIPAWFAAHR
jgi:poly(3-hydroxybutyrate) depolymerase